MRLRHFKNAAVHVVHDMEKNHTMAFAAALSYYFVVALFPFLIFLSTVVAYLPVPDFFTQVMGLIARVVPIASMGPLRNLMKDTILSRHSRLLTFGILFTPVVGVEWVHGDPECPSATTMATLWEPSQGI